MNRSNHKTDIFSGVRWSAAAAYACQGIQFASSLVLARLLAPEHFGLIAMANVFVGLANTFASLGFSQVVIQRRAVSDELLCSLFYATTAFAAVLSLALACSSPALSWVYGTAEISPIIVAMSLAFVLRATCLVPGALMTRRMEFGRLAVIDISTALLTSAAAVTLAWSGWGVWSLVWPSVANPLMRIPMVYLASGWRPKLLFSWVEFRGAFGFGAYLTGNSLFAYLMRSSDNFIIGSCLGAQPLGYYSLAYGLMLKPRDIVTRVIQRVLFPVLCQAQNDDERFRAIYLRICGSIAFVSFPATLGFLAVADLFVDVVLGAKWQSVVPLIYVLGPVGMLQSVALTAPKIYVAKGRADWAFWWGICANSVFVMSFLIGITWGVMGVAVSYAIANLALFIPYFLVPFRLVENLKVRDVLSTLFPYFFQSAIMGLIVVFCRMKLPLHRFGDTGSLFASVAIGAFAYLVLIFWTKPPALSDAIRLLTRHHPNFKQPS